MLVSANQYENARARLQDNVRVIECSSNDAWMRDIGSTFVVNNQGEIREILLGGGNIHCITQQQPLTNKK